MSRKSEYNNYFPDEDRFDLSIDGKSWAYRDPNNQEKIARDSAGDDNYYGFKGTGSGNEDSYEFTNPLYDYSQGQVRDVAEQLGISNVDEPEEVDQILAGLRGSFSLDSDDGGSTPVDEPDREPIEVIYDGDNDGELSDFEKEKQIRQEKIDEHRNNLATFGDRLFPRSPSDDFATAYKNKVMSGLAGAGIATRGPGSGLFGEGF